MIYTDRNHIRLLLLIILQKIHLKILINICHCKYLSCTLATIYFDLSLPPENSPDNSVGKNIFRLRLYEPIKVVVEVASDVNNPVSVQYLP